MNIKVVGILVSQKWQADRILESLFNKGYAVTRGELSAKKSFENIFIFTMDQNAFHAKKVNGYLFDEILIPYSAPREWDNLFRQRLKNLGSIVKLYRE